MLKFYSYVLVSLLCFLTSDLAKAYTANQVTFQFLDNGRFRVNLYYTVPALKEFREAYVEFEERKKAEAFYFDVLRGADFYLEDEPETKFVNEPLAPSPW
jgi:hypothetical protein